MNGIKEVLGTIGGILAIIIVIVIGVGSLFGLFWAVGQVMTLGICDDDCQLERRYQQIEDCEAREQFTIEQCVLIVTGEGE